MQYQGREAMKSSEELLDEVFYVDISSSIDIRDQLRQARMEKHYHYDEENDIGPSGEWPWQAHWEE